MMWLSLETTPKTITVAAQRVVRCVDLCPQVSNRPDLHFEGSGNGPIFITWIGREHDLYSSASRSLNIVSLSDMIEGSYRSLDSYTTGQRVDSLLQKKKPVFIKQKWNHVVFSRATILSFHPVYYKKFKTSYLIISNNTSPSTGLFDRTNVVYLFKCSLGDCVSKENSEYVGHTTTTLYRRLTMHPNDDSSIAFHL